MLRFMGSQRVGHDRATELNRNELFKSQLQVGHRVVFICIIYFNLYNILIRYIQVYNIPYKINTLSSVIRLVD